MQLLSHTTSEASGSGQRAAAKESDKHLVWGGGGQHRQDSGEVFHSPLWKSTSFLRQRAA